MLTTKQVEALRPKEKKYKAFDMEGLYIEVLPSGTKSWRHNYKDSGKNLTKTYGNYPAMSLNDARRAHGEFRESIGQDAPKYVPKYEELRDDWLKLKLPEIKSYKHKQQLIYRVNDLCSKLNGLPIDSIKRAKFVEVVQDIQAGDGENERIETARRVAMHLCQIFDYAVDRGDIESHAAAKLSRVLKRQKVKHMGCIDVEETHALLNAILTIKTDITRNGLLFVAHTFVRSNEIRYMRWDEIIEKKRVWVIPEDKMKKRIPHVVPLSPQALDILQAMKAITGQYDYVFASPTNIKKPMSENCLLDGLERIGYKHRMTVHGFRSLASTVLNLFSPFKEDVIERQLAHKEKDRVRAAYNRAEYLDDRIKLMDWYSNWLMQQLEGHQQ